MVNVEFVLIDALGHVSKEPLTESELDCLKNATRGIQLAAKIVDMVSN